MDTSAAWKTAKFVAKWATIIILLLLSYSIAIVLIISYIGEWIFWTFLMIVGIILLLSLLLDVVIHIINVYESHK